MARHFMNKSMGAHMGADDAALPAKPAAAVADEPEAPFDVEAMSQAIALCVRDFLANGPKEEAAEPAEVGDEDSDYGLGG